MPTGTLTNIGQKDWISVALNANQAYEITVNGLSQYGSVSIDTADDLSGDGAFGAAVSSDIGAAAAVAAGEALYFMPAVGGVYEIDISDPYAFSASESYTVFAGATTADYTDNASAPGTVAVGGETSGTLTNTGQDDWVAVTLTANQAYEITVNGLSDYGSVTIGTAAGVAADGVFGYAIPSTTTGDAGTTTENMYFMPSASGTYYIDISDSHTLAAPQPYTVAVAATTADYTDNPTTTGSVAVGGSTTGTLTNIGQHDWIAVTLAGNQAYEITVTGLSGDGAVSIGDAAGLAGDGQSAMGVPATSGGDGTTTAETLYFMPSAGGHYYVDVSDAYSSVATEPYTVAVAAVSADYTDNPTRPGSVAVGGVTTGTLTNIGQKDWVAVSLTANQAYEVTVNGLSAGGSVSIGTAQGLSEDGLSSFATANFGLGGGSATPQSIYFMPSATGTYYVDVSDPYPASTSETYSVAVAATTADYTDNPTAPGSVTVGGQTTGSLTNTGQIDWIAVNMTANQAYEVTVTGLSPTGSVTIGTAAGKASDGQSASGIVDNGEGSAPAGVESMYFMPSASGTYYIAVSDASASSSSEAYTVAVAATTADYTDNPSAPGTIDTGLACFAEGTRIATARGEIAVEQVRPGDIAMAHFAGRARIVWTGHRHVDCRRHPRPHEVQPIRVRRDAFGEGRPVCDLLLSPDHAVFVDGVLIPVRHLVNGATVVREAVARVTYWHVELDRHDVLLAHGMPCESYLDTGNRGAFANATGPVDVHPDFARRAWAAQACAPHILGGPPLILAKRRALAQAGLLGHATTRDPNLRVLARGRVLAVASDGPVRRVDIPHGTDSVMLASRICVPTWMRAEEIDARPLGVAVARMWLDRREIDLASLGRGWHAPEPGLRWTDGGGLLAVAGVRELAFELAMTGTYWDDGEAANTAWISAAAASPEIAAASNQPACSGAMSELAKASRPWRRHAG
jgi:hypothetical protein